MAAQRKALDPEDPEEDTFTLDGVEIVRATDRAILVRVSDYDEEWIPKSQVDPASTIEDTGDRGRLVVSGWFARKIGWTT